MHMVKIFNENLRSSLVDYQKQFKDFVEPFSLCADVCITVIETYIYIVQVCYFYFPRRFFFCYILTFISSLAFANKRKEGK